MARMQTQYQRWYSLGVTVFIAVCLALHVLKNPGVDLVALLGAAGLTLTTASFALSFRKAR